MSLYRLKGTAGSAINRTFDLGERLVVDDAAEVRFDGRRITLRRLDNAVAVQVNGEPVTGTAAGDEAVLGSGDEIRVGSSRYIVQAPGLRPDRVLTGDAVRPRRPFRLWWAIALAVAALLAIAWHFGWFDAWLVSSQE